jgi:hypothetical protein
MAAYAAIKGQEEPDYDSELLGMAFADDEEQSKEMRDWEYQQAFASHIYRSTGWYPT